MRSNCFLVAIKFRVHDHFETIFVRSLLEIDRYKQTHRKNILLVNYNEFSQLNMPPQQPSVNTDKNIILVITVEKGTMKKIGKKYNDMLFL